MCYMTNIVFLALALPVVFAENKTFEYFVFTQMWPPSSCIEAPDHKCSIKTPDSTISTWTVHGLWPSNWHGNQPFNCDSAHPFSEDKIKPIEAQLLRFWPNLFADTAKTQFWKHEWDKHGTCCESIPKTHDELTYFTQGLKLRAKFDWLKIFAVKGLRPSNETFYELDDFLSFINDTVGVTPRIVCAYDKATKHKVIFQIELCLSKSFKPIECQKNHMTRYHSEECPKSGIMYPTFPKHNNHKADVVG